MDLVTRSVIIIVTSLVLFGLGAYGYSFKRQQFDAFAITTIYTIVIITTYCVLYLKDIINDINLGNFDINNVGKLYYYMNILAGTVSYLIHTIFARRHINFLNIAKQNLYDIILYLDDGQMYRQQVIMVAIKALLFPALLQTTLIVRALHFEPDRSLMWTIYAFIPYIIRTTPATSVYGAMLLSTAFMQSINQRVQKIVDEVNRMHTHKEWLLKTAYHRMQKYQELSDEIDVLNEKYTTILDITNEFIDFSSFPWLSSMLCNVVGIMLGFFTQYMSIADTVFNKKEYDYYNVMTDSAFMLISFMEIYTQASICSDKAREVRKTGVILQKADTMEADVRLRESMDFFSLRILHRDYKIKPLGLIEVDLLLVHGVFSTVTGFLLILIQSDLSRRFLQ